MYVLIMYVNSMRMFCILLSLFYLYCVQIALLYSNVRLSHNKRLLTYLILQVSNARDGVIGLQAYNNHNGHRTASDHNDNGHQEETPRAPELLISMSAVILSYQKL